MDEQYFSIKEMADILGVTKQRVYRCIKNNCISEVHHKTVRGNDVLMYDRNTLDAVEKLLKSNSKVYREKDNEVHCEVVNSMLYESIVKQLEEKDKQIANMQKQLDDMNERLREEQEALKNQQSLNLLDKQKILELESKKEEVVEEPSKKWWQKFR